MAVENLRLLPGNHLDDVSLTVTSEESEYPKEYLQVSRPSWRWRSTSAAEQEITWDNGEELGADMFAIVNSNLTADSELHLELATDAGYSTLVLDETFDGQLPYYGLGEGPLGLIALGGYTYPNRYIPILYHIFAAGTVAYRYGRLTITDAGNADGYVEAGRIIVSHSWQPTINHNWNATHDIEKDSQIEFTPAGGAMADPAIGRKVVEVSFSWLDNTEDDELAQIIEAYGRNGNVLLTCYPGEGAALERNFTVYGPLIAWGRSQRLQTRTQGRSIKVSETK